MSDRSLSPGRISRDLVRANVAEVLFEARGRELADYIESARLFDDLAFESIDFLEISFLLRERFGLEEPGFPTDELGILMSEGLTPSTGEVLSISEATSFVRKLKEVFFHTITPTLLFDLTNKPAEDLRQSIQDIFTVGFVVDYVIGRMKAKRSAA